MDFPPSHSRHGAHSASRPPLSRAPGPTFGAQFCSTSRSPSPGPCSPPPPSLASALWPPQAPRDSPDRWWCPVARPLTLLSPVVQVFRPAPVSPSGPSHPNTSEDQGSPPFVSTPDFPAGSPVPSAATYPRRGPGAVAGSWRRCGGRSGPSTPRCGAAQPLDESPASSCAPFPGLGRSKGCLETNLGAAGNETTPQAGTLATGQANTQGGGRPAPGVLLGGESLLFILAHTPPTRRRTSWW